MLGVLSNPYVFHLQQKYCNTYDTVVDEFRDIIDCKGKKILDLGCSTGTAGAQIVNLKDNDYHGIDLMAPYVEFASRKNPHGTYHQMDGRDLSFPEGEFGRPPSSGPV